MADRDWKRRSWGVVCITCCVWIACGATGWSQQVSEQVNAGVGSSFVSSSVDAEVRTSYATANGGGTGSFSASAPLSGATGSTFGPGSVSLEGQMSLDGAGAFAGTEMSTNWNGSSAQNVMNAPALSRATARKADLAQGSGVARPSRGQTSGVEKGSFPDSTRGWVSASPSLGSETLHFFVVRQWNWSPDFASRSHLNPSYLVRAQPIRTFPQMGVKSLGSLEDEGLEPSVTPNLNSVVGLGEIPDPLANQSPGLTSSVPQN